CRPLPGHMAGVIEAAGFPVRLMAPADGDDPAGGAWDRAGSSSGGAWDRAGSSSGGAWDRAAVTADADETAALLAGEKADWLAVDHYGLGADWERRIRPRVAGILAIDDFAEAPRACDILLGYIAPPEAATRYRTLTPAGCRLLIGPRYALLDAAYAGRRRPR